MIIVGAADYQYRLSFLAYLFKGGLNMEYLEAQGYKRIEQLVDHAGKIGKEIEKNSG